jgi:hypothetical protein
MVHMTDCVSADAVFPDRFSENLRVYYNQEHRWYYVENLRDDEVLVFRQVDSSIVGGGGKCY